MKTIILVNNKKFNNEKYDYEIDYREKYNEYNNDIHVYFWYDKNDLMDVISNIVNQVDVCNTLIIEK